jgi:hypothetical protein
VGKQRIAAGELLGSAGLQILQPGSPLFAAMAATAPDPQHKGGVSRHANLFLLAFDICLTSMPEFLRPIRTLTS